jgi:tRNA (guanine37-N1)-methyltransferase
MKISVLTLFPEMFAGFLTASILGRAQSEGRIEIELVQLRDFALDRHRKCDDQPYGGGPGMVLSPEPLARALEALDARNRWTVYLTPSGRLLDQRGVAAYAERDSVILIAGRYEGVDQRIVDLYVDDEVSIGDYVLAGGEVPAMVLIEAVSRLLSGVIKDASLREESFVDGWLEYPHYTRPEEFAGLRVPDVLLSGHHAQIVEWRRTQSVAKTSLMRPDLLNQATANNEETSG